ncbi:unnamed protein product [Adineta steineri]|uniref:Uncharacterized protein n=1 Tax=Adineta steineri TaxID=433720 RepID=A0A815UX28_9BILA|nr:unnamed protein product [Adineta steineri]CAF1522096.1 unnamed protein product [Adineta steineri]CAF3838865.1 unnamed protein product [Adineta steineri]CAF4283734.1 unnamed protein product [Adineta steineri]
MAGLIKDLEGGFMDNTADRVVDDFIPDKNGEIGRIMESGVNQYVNNEINSKMDSGVFDGNTNQGQSGSGESFW